MKFTPKHPKRKTPTNPSQPTRNASDEDSQWLPRRFRTGQCPRHDANEKKPSPRVAFGSSSAAKPSTTSQPGIVIRESDETMLLYDTVDDSGSDEGTYQEPWDYEGTYYPTTLPVRRPHSGHPDILDETEFGEAASNENFNEKNVNAAEKLGLQDESEQKSFLLFKLPKPLPVSKEPSSSSEPIGARGSDWEHLAEGRVGKLLVYKSGTVKLKLGEVLYDVYPGTGDPCEQAVAMDVRNEDCCLLGQLKKRAVVSVDVKSILDASTGK